MPDKPEDLENQLASMLKMEGLVNDDPQVVAWMDEKPGEAPQVLPISLKKDGSFSKTSSIASEEQLMNWDILCIGALNSWPGDGWQEIYLKIHI